MSSPMPDDLGARGTETMAPEEQAERSANVISGASQAMESETSEAKQAKMEAQKYAKLAREASLRYSRLAPSDANLRPQSLHNKLQVAANSDSMAHERRIYRTEIAVGATTVANQFVSSLSLDPDRWHGRVVPAAIRWLPLWFLPAKHGTSGFQKLISRPAVLGGAAVVASAGIREIVEKIGEGKKPTIWQKAMRKVKDESRLRMTSRDLHRLERDFASVARLRKEETITDEEQAALRKQILGL
jgi:hypothetical protein